MENTKKDFGVLYGQRTAEEYLLIYSSYEDSKASPNTGDFIVLTQRDESGTKFLARIEAEIYDEDPIFRSQDKTLVSVHYARIAERELSDRDKQKIFSYTYKVNILGTYTDDGKNFTTAVRKLPFVSYLARHINSVEFDNIINGANKDGIPIGKLCIGVKIQIEKKDILFDIEKLRNKRTMIFAQSGFGKTNLMKVLLYNMLNDTNYGKLIFDLNGEYVLRSENTYGLGDIDEPKIKDNLVVYLDKKFDEKYKNRFIYAGQVRLNLVEDFDINDVLQLSTGLTSAGKTFLEFVDSIPNKQDSKDFFNNIFNKEDPKEVRAYAYRRFSSYFETKKAETDEPDVKTYLRSMLGGVIRQIKSFKSIHLSNSNLVKDVQNYLKQGKTVIIDLSLQDSTDASMISTIIVRKLFENNKLYYTEQEEDKIINSVICVEEAQNVLSEEFVKSSANPFVRVAKEGRKFGIGLIAITQRPSAIAEEIRTQAENFFAFYMGNSKDIKALVESNINYGGVISNFLQKETIVGNMYMVSSNQSFALPMRVVDFKKLVDNKVYPDSKLNID